MTLTPSRLTKRKLITPRLTNRCVSACLQKFEFCGKLDCPDWILAQLFHASKLELDKFKLICESVRDTILADGQFDDELFAALGLDEEYFDIDDARACFAAINYIISNSCLYQVTSECLRNELEQLGLPGEHCECLCGIMDKSLDELKEHLFLLWA